VLTDLLGGVTLACKSLIYMPVAPQRPTFCACAPVDETRMMRNNVRLRWVRHGAGSQRQ
jgi:hypothetical protein